MEKKLMCGECKMAFRSAELLAKHKAKFCVGSEVHHLRVHTHSSPVVLRNNGGAIEPRQTRTADLVQTGGQQRTTTGGRSTEAEPESSRGRNTADGVALLTDQFQKLRVSIEETLIHTSKRASDAGVSGQQLGHSERLERMRDMATLHERQLAMIRVQHKQLEQQRDELSHQAGVRSEQSVTSHLEALLMELREQEERNEETLQHLREHLHALPSQQDAVCADQTQPQSMKRPHETNELMSSADGPLSAQIRALRRAYMQSGATDPDIVAQMIDLQAEAQSLERHQPAAAVAKKKKVKSSQRGASWELLVVEQENQRLEEEILRIQIAREQRRRFGGWRDRSGVSHCGSPAAAARTELMHRHKRQPVFSLQAETGGSRAARRLSGLHPSPPHPGPLHSEPHTRAHLSPLQTRTLSTVGRRMTDNLESLDPAPYDPVAGLVVFFDLVMGVDSTQKLLRLVAAFYSDGHQVGTLSPTHPVRCQPHHPGNYAVLSVKQPVSRIQPSPSLCLVVEVQAADELDAYDEEDLVACGWTQLELFDQHNQLRSGSWRLPVRSPPIRPSVSPLQLNSIPQVGNMELCVCLVNGQDHDAQSLPFA
ncbi:coiled-coil domain-containing protein 17 [Betta splendens]|uniref:Coiled-coil domain-containing protein 17 n=1 Tax=Betta splendens TaxID=158456 RepID=A0A9W2XSB5_BETSP|nr:coiled-coil domain-containing protein 17 [Betta splendens]